jgi:15-cis-phytoene synthase/lycopene beta-cyclase
VLYAPLCTRLDLYKIAFLITIAVTSTIPWDSYLIRNSIWSYPENVVMGPKILLYLFLSKPTLHSTYLVKEKKGSKWKVLKVGGQLILGLAIKKSYDWIKTPGQYTYMGLILVWACPFLLLLWSLAYQLLVKLPFANTTIPIAIPTLYLWAVDSLALQRGTWPGSRGGCVLFLDQLLDRLWIGGFRQRRCRAHCLPCTFSESACTPIARLVSPRFAFACRCIR